jgi:hypothetical protein
MNLSDIAIWYRRVLSGDELGSSYIRSSVVYIGAGLIAALNGLKNTRFWNVHIFGM